jgi:hypothetical protein
MSRSNPNAEMSNPSTRFFEWSGGSGQVKYYDKENKEDIFVELPFTFLVLDQLSTIKGYSDADKSGYWSNEVRDLRKEIFVVRTKAGIVKTGYYADLVDIQAKGAKYAKSVYIAYFNDERELVIGNIKMYGSAIGAWIEFCKANNVNNDAVSLVDATPEKKGKTDYFVPVFKRKDVSDATNETAIELDKQLQTYLSVYFDKPLETATTEEKVDDYIDQRNAEINNFVPPPESNYQTDEEIPF